MLYYISETETDFKFLQNMPSSPFLLLIIESKQSTVLAHSYDWVLDISSMEVAVTKPDAISPKQSLLEEQWTKRMRNQ